MAVRANSSPAVQRAVRVAFGTVMGLVFGVFVVSILDRVGQVYGAGSFAARMWVLLSEAVLGFGIAISGLRMHWALHGSMLGLIFTLPMSIWLLRNYSIYSGGSNGVRVFVMILILGIIFGLLIELVLSPILKTRRSSEE